MGVLAAAVRPSAVGFRSGQAVGLHGAGAGPLAPTVGSSWFDPVWWVAQVLSWLALIMSLLRGVPVVAEAFSWGKAEASE